MSNYKNIDTALIHGGIAYDEFTGAVNVPVYLSSTFKQDGLGCRRRGYEYARTGNPTREALESLMAELDHGVAAFAFASGLAAIHAVLSLYHSGDNIVITSNVYGGTYRLLDKVFSHFGLTYTIADTSDVKAFESSLTPETKAVLIESPANPLMSITNIAAIATSAHRHGIQVIVDNTWQGQIYSNQIFRPVKTGDKLKGYVTQVRFDGKIDVALQPSGPQQTADFAEVLLSYLQSHGGICPVGDKSDTDDIRQLFQVSKKVFKRAVGDLYKRRLIVPGDTAISLVKDEEKTT